MLEKDEEPFNDIMDHFDKTTGRPEKIEMKTLPNPIRILGYVLITCVVVSTLLIIVMSLSD
ncbi:amino acid transporter [Sporolactobacillus sp. STSJ-5]|uniref:amino acid transporter n=1 Tax=Sporolactobacillus sp. STSJ-5 TaxID=2965076 RepID=UPI00210579FA|nr:amino acid transporter [Sporolactobacillus sp. STSJ-5]MCQ2010946.1 amino acid transporter [Sporolactobacillus sp. STSJ-5]